jgi:anti-sigma factor RsiW
MAAPIDTRTLNAFVDGELDLAREVEIESLLQGDPALQAQVDLLRGLRDAVRRQADYHPAPSELRRRIAALARHNGDARQPEALGGPGRPGQRVGLRSDRGGRRPRWHGLWPVIQRWFAWRPMLVWLAVTAAATLALQAGLAGRGRVDRLAEEVIASHVRATLSQRLVDIASSDHHRVKPGLAARLDYSPPVVEATRPGAELVGGRVDYLDGRPVAALVYRHGEHVAESFVWPTQDADREPALSSARGFQIAHWNRQGMAHWLISDLNPTEFAALVADLDRSAR